jgi:hypothetical protein
LLADEVGLGKTIEAGLIIPSATENRAFRAYPDFSARFAAISVDD